MTDLFRYYDPETRTIVRMDGKAAGGTIGDHNATVLHFEYPKGFMDTRIAYIVFNVKDDHGNYRYYSQNTTPAFDGYTFSIPSSILSKVKKNNLSYGLGFVQGAFNNQGAGIPEHLAVENSIAQNLLIGTFPPKPSDIAVGPDTPTPTDTIPVYPAPLGIPNPTDRAWIEYLLHNALMGVSYDATLDKFVFTSYSGNVWDVSVAETISADEVRYAPGVNLRQKLDSMDAINTTLMDSKVDKIPGKGLSTNDLTDERLAKLLASASLLDVAMEHALILAVEGKIDTHIADLSNPHAVTKAQVGLGSVDNTADADKPISTATMNAINLILASISATDSRFNNHLADTSNPHAVTKAQVGLGNVDNTADASKPVSTHQQTALDAKVDKVSGFALSSNDYTATEKIKLAGIAAGAEVNVNADWTAADGDAQILNKPVLGTAASKNTGISVGDVPIIGGNGKLHDSIIPPLAIGEFAGSVTVKANLVTLATAQQGDIAKVSADSTIDNNGVWFLNGIYSDITAWIQIVGPGSVITVNGQSGIVNLTYADVNAVPVTRTVNTKPLSADVVLDHTDVNAVPVTRRINEKPLSADVALDYTDVGAVPVARTVNTKPLSADVVLNAADVNAVPTTRTVNTKPLSADIVLSADDVNAVPTSRTVNAKPLSSNVVLSASDVGAVPVTRTVNTKPLSADIIINASDVNAVPTSRTVNNKPLSSDVVLNATDVGALSSADVVDNVSGFAIADKPFSAKQGAMLAKNKIETVSVIPVANSSRLGHSFMLNTEQAGFIKGHVYICVQNGSVYSWEDLSPTLGTAAYLDTGVGTNHVPKLPSPGVAGQSLRLNMSNDALEWYTPAPAVEDSVKSYITTVNAVGKNIVVNHGMGNIPSVDVYRNNERIFPTVFATTTKATLRFSTAQSCELRVVFMSSSTAAAATTIAVTLTDPTGTANANRTITATGGGDIATAVTNASGTASITVGGSGTYKVKCQHVAGYVVEPVLVEVAAGASTSVNLTMQKGFVYGLAYDSLMIDTGPGATLVYDNDAEGYTPISNTSTTLASITSYGSWTGAEPLLSKISFATVSSTGALTMLNPDNLALNADDTASAITTDNTMLLIDKLYIRESNGVVYVSDLPSQGEALAHTYGGAEYDTFGVGVFPGFTLGGKLMSISGRAMTRDVNRPTFRTQAQANGTGWMLWSYYQHLLYRIIVTLLSKTFDSQSAIGRGGANYATQLSGVTNAMGLFAGDVSGNASSVKALIENPWGHAYNFIDDIVGINGIYYINQSLTPDDTATGKTALPIQPTQTGFPRDISTNLATWGIGTAALAGSASVGLTDAQWFSGSSTRSVAVGGYTTQAANGEAGLHTINGQYSATSSSDTLGARVAYVFNR